MKIFLEYSKSYHNVLLFYRIILFSRHGLIMSCVSCVHHWILFSLSPHTPYALQPLDVAVFKSLKDHFSKSVRALAFAKPNFVVAKRDFAKVSRAHLSAPSQQWKGRLWNILIPILLPQPKCCPPPFIRHLHFPVHPFLSPVGLLFVHRHLCVVTHNYGKQCQYPLCCFPLSYSFSLVLSKWWWLYRTVWTAQSHLYTSSFPSCKSSWLTSLHHHQKMLQLQRSIVSVLQEQENWQRMSTLHV